MPTTDRIRRLSGSIVHTVYPFEEPQWTPDGRSILIKLAPTGPDAVHAAGLPISDRGTFASPVPRVFDAPTDSAIARGNPGLDAYSIADLALIDVRTGHVQRLVRAVATPSYAVSPTGALIAFAALRGSAGISSQDSRIDIAVVDVTTGAIDTVARDLRGIELGNFTWSPGGTALAYTITSYAKNTAEDAFVIPIKGGTPTNVTPGRHPPFGTFARGPLWSADARFLLLIGGDTLWRASVDGNQLQPIATLARHHLGSIVAPAYGTSPWHPRGPSILYVTTRDDSTQREGIAQIDLAMGATRYLFEEDITGLANWTDVFTTDANDSDAVFVLERANAPPELWIENLQGGGRPRQLTDINSSVAGNAFGTTHLVNWRGLDGDSLHGVLLLPSDYVPSHRVPLIVWVYGGITTSHELNRFGLTPEQYNMQVLATRGYAVLAPDAPQHLGTPMLDLAKTVLPGINTVIDMGIADPGRLGVGGYSYGGYSTMALLAQTPRFRAAVTVAGTGSLLLAEYGLLNEQGFSWGVGWAESGQGLMGGSPWAQRDHYIENSPFFYLDRVNTPLLLIHGGRDDPYLSEETYTALRRLGKEVVLVEYPGVRHAFSLASFSQQSDYYRRILDWYDQHIGRGSQATHVSEEETYRDRGQERRKEDDPVGGSMTRSCDER